MEERYFAAEAEVSRRVLECAALTNENSAHHKIHTLTSAQMNEHEAEIEASRAECLVLRTALLESDQQLSRAQNFAVHQKRDLSRLRTDLVQNATTHSERTLPFNKSRSNPLQLTDADFGSTFQSTKPLPKLARTKSGRLD